MESNVVINGCGRSGTSILGELFEHVTAYEYYFEPQIEELKDAIAQTQKRIAAKVPKGGTTLTEGLACDVPELLNILGKGTKFIWIVRNPFDAVCSLRPGIEDGWSHNPKPTNYQQLLESPWYTKAAYHWRYINDRGYHSLNHYGEVYVIKYEQLLAEPFTVVKEVLNKLNIQMSEKDLLNYTGKISNNTKNSYHAKHQVHWFRDNHKTRVNRYKENLSQEQVQEIWDIVGDVALTFDYKYA